MATDERRQARIEGDTPTAQLLGDTTDDNVRKTTNLIG
jgi:hypothetical protein